MAGDLSPVPRARTLRLWLVRHARPQVATGICYGASDVPAYSEDTLLAAQQLNATLPPNAIVRVSGLQRAQRLAEALHGLRPEWPIAEVDERLNEMDFGAWELQQWDAIDRIALDAWADDFAHYRPGGGENVVGLLARVRAALNATTRAAVEEASDTVADAVWITHAGVIRAVQYLHTPQAPLVPVSSAWPRMAPAFGAWTVLDLPLRG